MVHVHNIVVTNKTYRNHHNKIQRKYKHQIYKQLTTLTHTHTHAHAHPHTHTHTDRRAIVHIQARDL